MLVLRCPAQACAPFLAAPHPPPHWSCVPRRPVNLTSHFRVVQEDASCCICIGEYTDGAAVRVLPRCNHHFHQSCASPLSVLLRSSTVLAESAL